MRPLGLLLLTGTSLTLSAQLSPHQDAPLSAHLLEVNAQWAVRDALPADAIATTHFTDEAARIATHLRLVREHLLTHTPEGLSAEQLEARLKLLDDLGTYADRRLFPQNHVLPYRNPVFIDPDRTACAVGQLMIQSRNGELAERISSELNLGYVSEILADDRFHKPVADWANAHGFTADELAWIQPGYPPSIPWAPLGGGTNGPVKVLLPMANGHLLVAGAFTEAGGGAANGVAIWNGGQFVPLGDGISGDISCAAEHDGTIYIGGSMINGMNDLAAWDGNSWSFDMVFESKLPVIYDLHVHDGMLHASGAGAGFAGQDHRVMRRQGGTWVPLGSPFNEAVLSLESYNGVLVAGGAFTQPVGSTDPLLLHVARFDGDDWYQLGDGLDATVHDLLLVDGVLHAGGDLFAGPAVTFGLARIGGTSETWEWLLPGHADYMTGGPDPMFIASLASHGGMLYLAGTFDLFSLMVVGNHMASFNGTPDGVEPLAALDQAVNAVAVSDDRIIMGGDFNLWLPHLAAVDMGTGNQGPWIAAEGLDIVPSPAVDITTIHLPHDAPIDAEIHVLDASGRTVPVHVERSPGRYRMDISQLDPGLHLVHITTSDGVRTGRFIKE